MRAHRFAHLAVGLLLIAPSVADAEPFFLASVSTSAAGQNFLIGLPSDCIDLDSDSDQGSVPVAVSGSSSISCTGSGGTSVTSTGSGSATAAGPTLHASATATASGSTFAPATLSSANSDVSASIVDEFIITGSGLFELSLSVTGSLVTDCFVRYGQWPRLHGAGNIDGSRTRHTLTARPRPCGRSRATVP